MGSPQPCPCCSRAPVEQKGNSATFLTNKDVLTLLSSKRSQPGQRSKPLKSFMCSPFVGNNIGGSTCRDNGGCEAKEEQCLTYKITAPYYNKMLPFLLSSKAITENIKKVKELDDAVKKHKTKTSVDAMKEREDHEVYLNKPFKALMQVERVTQLIKTCPSRRR